MKILVTGKNGLIGTALLHASKSIPHQVVFVGREEADLTKDHEVEFLFRIIKPDWVIHTAAKVGGISDQIEKPADYFYDNTLMNALTIHNAWKWGVKKFLAISSACVFSPDVSVFKEDLIHDGSPHSTQFAYAAAKRNIDIQIHAYKKQHLIQNYCSIILGNAFGKSDNYQLNSAYLIPSLIHKIFVAKKSDQPLKVWGDGAPKREFIYADDVAKILFKILELDFIPERILVAGERQITIKEIAQRLCKAADFKQEILWETDKPQGPATRCSDLSLLQSLVGSITYTQIDDALRESYQWFEKNYEHARK